MPPFKKYILPVAAICCLWPGVSAAVALALGVLVALVCGNFYADLTRKYTPRLLAFSVVGLGAGMNLDLVLQAGVKGLGYTVIGIALCIGLGWLIGKAMRAEKESSILITIGTAICGGSAIAAIAPVLNAKHQNISVALAVVFCLNALALLIFPAIGHWAQLTQHQFGLWAALAIHDTSSVVGASLQYGPEALEVATTVKLARALWIVPLVFLVQFMCKNSGSDAVGNTAPARRKYPWFILGFLAMAAIVTWVPALAPAGHVIEQVARQLLILTLFLIGSNLTMETLKAVGFRPLLQGFILWVIVAAVSLLAVYAHWIS